MTEHAPKTAAVLVRSASARNRNGAEALRGAVGLAAYGLQVTVVLCEDGVLALGQGGQAAQALSTLRLLGHSILVEKESLEARAIEMPPWAEPIGRNDLPGLLATWDAVETWR